MYVIKLNTYKIETTNITTNQPSGMKYGHCDPLTASLMYVNINDCLINIFLKINNLVPNYGFFMSQLQ